MSNHYRSRHFQDSPSSSFYYGQAGSSGSHPYRREDRRGFRNEVEHTLSGESLPPELTRLMDSLRCRLCAVESTSYVTAKLHYSGKSHAKKVKRFLERYSREKRPPIPEDSKPSFHGSKASIPNYCEICRVTLLSEADRITHYSSKTHRRNEENPEKVKIKIEPTLDLSGPLEIGENLSLSEINPYVCEICNVKAVSEEQLQAHLDGKRHKENLEKQKLGRTDASSEDKPFACDVCDVSFESRRLYNIHIQGKRHSKALMRLEFEESDYCEICDITFTSFEHYDAHVKGKKHEKMCLNGSNLRFEEQASIACKFCPYVGNVQNHECDRSLAKRFAEEKNLKNKIVCLPCSMIFDTEEELADHKTSRRHVLITLNENGDQVVEEIKFWYCIVCKIQYRNNREYTEHLFGETHMSAAKQDFVPDANTNLYQCHVCDLILDVGIKDEHEKDKKHIEKGLRKEIQESIKKLANEDLKTQSFHCNHCKVTMDGFIKYSQHVLSASHIDKLLGQILNESS